MKPNPSMVEKYGKPTHKPPRGYVYKGGAMAIKARKGDEWGSGSCFCLWCGHVHEKYQGGIMAVEYHHAGCPAAEVLV